MRRHPSPYRRKGLVLSRNLALGLAAFLLGLGLLAPAPVHAGAPTGGAASAVTKVVWDPEPTIATIGPGLKVTLTMATYMYDQTGQPMVGERVQFSLFNKAPSLYDYPPKFALEVCAAVTDETGLATCKGKGLVGAVLSLAAGGYATRTIGPFPSATEFTRLPTIVLG